MPKQWRYLLHYQDSAWGKNVVSEVDSQEFFLSPQGKSNWQEEWRENVEGLLLAENTDSIDSNHPRCRFVARTKFLEKFYNVKAAIPEEKCTDFQNLKRKLNISRAYLVYAGQFVQRPASAFGHTFLRLSSKENSSHNPHLDYGLDFSAQVTTDNAFLYGIMGISGGFDGRFGLLAYTKKILEYGAIDQRDLWEYEIPLTSDQLDLLVAHIWELDFATFDYFYFDENCSYHVLSLLQTILPEKDLLGRLHPIVIPIDTIHSFAKNFPESRPTLRSGIYNKFKSSFAHLSSVQKLEVGRFIKNYQKNKTDQLPTNLSGREMKTIISWLDSFYNEEILSSPSSPAALMKFNLLQKLLVDSGTSDQSIQEESLNHLKLEFAPHRSNFSRRFSFGSRYHFNTKDDEYLLQYRWALSSWEERLFGRLPYTTLEMGDLELSNKNYFSHFYLLNIQNRNPIDLIDSQLSWGIKIGLRNTPWTPRKEIAPHLILNLGGFSLFGPLGVYPQMAMEAEIPKYQNNQNRFEIRFGPTIEGHLELTEEIHIVGAWKYLKLLGSNQDSIATKFHNLKVGFHYGWDQSWGIKIEGEKDSLMGNKALFLPQYYF